jgi:hypothetical protein
MIANRGRHSQSHALVEVPLMKFFFLRLGGYQIYHSFPLAVDTAKSFQKTQIPRPELRHAHPYERSTRSFWGYEWRSKTRAPACPTVVRLRGTRPVFPHDGRPARRSPIEQRSFCDARFRSHSVMVDAKPRQSKALWQLLQGGTR